MKFEYKVLFMLGTHAATCDRVVIIFTRKVSTITVEIHVIKMSQRCAC